MSAAVATAAARFLGATFTLLLTLASACGAATGILVGEPIMIGACLAMAALGAWAILRYDWPATWGPLLNGKTR